MRSVRHPLPTAPETADGRLIGYARVSTEDQNLDMQTKALLAAGVHPDNLHTDKISAAARKRPGLDLALRDCVEGDTLVVWKLDRLGRSVLDLLTKLQALEKRGVKFRSLTEGIDTNTIVGTLLLHILGAIAQFERSLIAQRTKTGIAAKKARGESFGPKPTVDVVKCAQWFREGWTVDQVRKQFPGHRGNKHLSRQAIYRFFDRRTIDELRKRGERRGKKRP